MYILHMYGCKFYVAMWLVTQVMTSFQYLMPIPVWLNMARTSVTKGLYVTFCQNLRCDLVIRTCVTKVYEL